MSTPQKVVRDDSPRSLATGGSGHYASPSTAATNYSPVETRNVTEHLYQSLAGKFGELGMNKSSQPMGGEDPFVTNVRRTNLSATAPDYHPNHRASIAELNHASIPEYRSNSMRSPFAQFSPSAFHGTVASVSSPTRVRNVGPARPDASSSIYRKFSTDIRPDGICSFTRYISLTGIDPEEADDRNQNGPLARFRESDCMMGARNIKKSADGLTIIFCYDHLMEAERAFKSGSAALSSQDFPSGWKLTFMEETDINDIQRTHEAQLLVTVASQYGSHSRSDLVTAVLKELTAISDIFAVEIMPSTPLAMRVEMYAVSAAETLVRLYGRSSPVKNRENLFMRIEYFSDTTNQEKALVNRRYSQQDMMLTPSKTGMSMSMSSPLRAVPQSTVVVPEKIRSGDDVRTTVMIRNIPNKVDAAQFKGILDSHVFGKYDFSYLRIDFQNLCNVGYAFVNFTQAEDIILLYEAIVGRHWNIYNSDKIAEMCYATIQGLDCCIEKFRNSSVMLEWQPHRPKLWFTEADGDLAGLERDFPPPTNYQKLQRSKDNAAEVGLYPPRGASAYRNDGRQQVSMLDRGHPRATDYQLTPGGVNRVLLTYPHLMNGHMSPALSPMTPPYSAHSFGQPSPISPFMPNGHQLYAPAMMPHTPTSAMFSGAVGMAQPDPAFMAMLAAQYSNQQRH